MIRGLRWQWHLFWQWAHEHLALFAKARFDAHWERAEHHGWRASLIDPRQVAPREWLPRLWSRRRDPRTDIEERRP